MKGLVRALHLAYSMLVYCLESLAQQFEEYEPTWDDYHEETRAKLDKELSQIPSESAQRIRDALLDGANLRLQQRYVAFAMKHLRPTFFKADAAGSVSTGLHSAFRPTNLREALLNAYTLRSGYVHRLQPLKKHLRMPSLSTEDTFELDGKIYPTIRGMVRLCLEVLEDFIATSQSAPIEAVKWRQDLSGIISMNMAPEYWIWAPQEFDQATSENWFGAVMQHVLDLFGSRKRRN